MKSYFNKDERNVYILILCLMGYLEDFINETELGKNERKNLKTAGTFLKKGTQEILERLGQKFAMQTSREIKASELMLLPKHRARIEKEEWEKIAREDQCVVNRDALESLIEKAVYWCCECAEDDKENCKLRQVFDEFSVTPYDLEGAQECQYENVR